MRVINRTIRLRNIFLDRHAAMFDVPLFPKLRLPETFAGSKLLRLASKTRELSEGTRPRLQPHPSPATLTPNPPPSPRPPHPPPSPATLTPPAPPHQA